MQKSILPTFGTFSRGRSHICIYISVVLPKTADYVCTHIYMKCVWSAYETCSTSLSCYVLLLCECNRNSEGKRKVLEGLADVKEM